LLEGWLQVQLELRENPECEYVITGRIPSRLIGYLLLFVPYTKVSFPTSSTGKIRVWRVMAGLYALLSNKEVLQLYIICVFSILGNFFHPLFFGGCMVDALRMSKLMQCEYHPATYLLTSTCAIVNTFLAYMMHGYYTTRYEMLMYAYSPICAQIHAHALLLI
jgi:hypothetical protein